MSAHGADRLLPSLQAHARTGLDRAKGSKRAHTILARLHDLLSGKNASKALESGIGMTSPSAVATVVFASQKEFILGLTLRDPQRQSVEKFVPRLIFIVQIHFCTEY